jgi:hypothetical protein
LSSKYATNNVSIFISYSNIVCQIFTNSLFKCCR